MANKTATKARHYEREVLDLSAEQRDLLIPLLDNDSVYSATVEANGRVRMRSETTNIDLAKALGLANGFRALISRKAVAVVDKRKLWDLAQTGISFEEAVAQAMGDPKKSIYTIIYKGKMVDVDEE
jgi:hypothetical protein